MVELVIVGKESGERYKVLLPQDPRFRFPGEEVEFTYTVGLPEDMAFDEYEIFLNFPDPMERLYERPEYSIRLANDGVTFTPEGYNDLGISFKVTDRQAPEHNTFLKFKKM